ncbi:MAG: hypothetical protein QW835_00050 [Candidatus Hadarchaeum sp.]
MIAPQLYLVPFIGQTDCSRVQMASKQMNQCLCSLNCDIPYVLGEKPWLVIVSGASEGKMVRGNSKEGIRIARDSGKIVFIGNEFVVYYYKNENRLFVDYVPAVKRVSEKFGARRRFVLPEEHDFEPGDVLWEYSGFNRGVPAFGYNVYSAFIPFFGYNYEDAIVISESLAEKAEVEMVETVLVPITTKCVFKSIYPHSSLDGLGFFPRPGTHLKNGLLCVRHDSSRDRRTLPEFLETRFIDSPTDDKIVTTVHNPMVLDFKIHRVQNRPDFFEDLRLEEALRKIHRDYMERVEDEKIRLANVFGGTEISNYLINSFYCYNDRVKNRHKLNLAKFVYVLEFTVVGKAKVAIGDKFSNRYAAKGVVSLILPDELRPVTERGEPIDYIYNPFGVFSRMNLGQVLEVVVAKNVRQADSKIRAGEDPAEVISGLNEKIISNLDKSYSNRVSELVDRLKGDPSFRNRFVDEVVASNLYIYAPYFKKINVRNLVRNGIPPVEKIVLKKGLLEYLRDKIGVDFPIAGDSVVRGFCGPQYVMRLNKLAKEIVNSRDIGPIRSLSGQPVRGRAKKGGSVVGQMEIEALIAHGCENFLREVVTVKSDRNQEKERLLESVIRNGSYYLSDLSDSSRTRMAIEALLRFFEE